MWFLLWFFASLAAIIGNGHAGDDGRCEPGTLNESKVKGKIVLCHHSDGDTSKTYKADVLKSAGAILVDSAEVAVATAYIDFPVTEVTSAAAAAGFGKIPFCL
jgi:hypothetical protein